MSSSWIFFGVTLTFLAALAVITVRLFRRGRADEWERPKHRMLDDD